MLYRIRVGCQWRELSPDFGHWNSVFKRFNDWSKKGKLKLIFKMLSRDPDLEWLFIDGSIVKAHQDSCGAAKKSEVGDHGIGKSVAGNTSKIHLAVYSSETRLIFNSLAERFAMLKLCLNSSQGYLLLSTPFQIRATIAADFESK